MRPRVCSAFCTGRSTLSERSTTTPFASAGKYLAVSQNRLEWFRNRIENRNPVLGQALGITRRWILRTAQSRDCKEPQSGGFLRLLAIRPIVPPVPADGQRSAGWRGRAWLASTARASQSGGLGPRGSGSAGLGWLEWTFWLPSANPPRRSPVSRHVGPRCPAHHRCIVFTPCCRAKRCPIQPIPPVPFPISARATAWCRRLPRTPRTAPC